MQAKKAFTLAEVLITLGIIGIVATTVIPGIVYNYQKTVALSKLKHTYAILQQAILRTVAENFGNAQVNFSDGDTQSMINWYNYYLKPNLKIQSECFDTPGCWHTSGVTKMLNGKTALWDQGTKGIGGNIIVFKTIDNVMVNMDGASPANITDLFGVNVSEPSLVIHVDVNGDNKPNVIGRDVFVFIFNNQTFVPAGNDRSKEEIAADCNETGRGYYCFSHIMRNNWELTDAMVF